MVSSRAVRSSRPGSTERRLSRPASSASRRGRYHPAHGAET
ncbi:hypothetical protein SAMN02745244_02758, partial [Tessaracoccus bendigoensis DSM 12906]